MCCAFVKCSAPNYRRNRTDMTSIVLKKRSFSTLISIVSFALGSIFVLPNSSFAADFQFAGPSSGFVNVASTDFTITTGGGFSGNIRVEIIGAGLDTTEMFNFSKSEVSKSFKITPLETGTVILTPHSQTGNPQQNGRHERMHLTLKQATTKPPTKTLLQQQDKFEDFIFEYNYERPHLH